MQTRLYFIIGFLIVVAEPSVLGAQTSAISILSPLKETITQPGGVIQVKVNAVNVAQAAIVGTDPIGSTEFQLGSGVLTFNVLLPMSIAPGRYYLRAAGVASAGGLVRSASVSILVGGVAISALHVNPNPMVLLAPGVRIGLDVRGVTGQRQLTLSPATLTFVSANPAIATVDSNGMVTGQSAGITSIKTTYNDGSTTTLATSSVQVLGGIRGDFNADGIVDIEDLSIITSSLNTPANGPSDARDLNHDGKIDALDARILETLCTYPRCATHQ
jgi:hypothetical protein